MSTCSAKPRLLFLLVAVTALLALAAAAGEEVTSPPAEPAPPAETGAPAGTTEEAPPATETEATEPAPEPASLRVALEWFPNPDHVALYYALENGYWDDQGLTVEFEDAVGPSAGLKLVATGKFDLAVYYERRHLLRAGAGLPVIAVASMIPTPLNSMISLADSKVQGPKRSRELRSVSPDSRSTMPFSRRSAIRRDCPRTTSRPSTSASTSSRRC